MRLVGNNMKKYYNQNRRDVKLNENQHQNFSSQLQPISDTYKNYDARAQTKVQQGSPANSGSSLRLSIVHLFVGA